MMTVADRSYTIDPYRVSRADAQMSRAPALNADAIPRRSDERIGDLALERDSLPSIVENERCIALAADDMKDSAHD